MPDVLAPFRSDAYSVTNPEIEVVPLEGLRVKPGEALILRLPRRYWSPAELARIVEQLEPLGLGNRVAILHGDIEVAVVEAE